MLKIAKIISLILLVLFLFYLILPSPDFPEKLPNSVQSFEPADVETPLRRSYYTDYSRQEVMNYYFLEFQKSKLFNLPFPTYKLNYPPEDAQTLIRDQARSTFLEEIVHPFRESVYINGFEPKEKKDAVNIAGKIWRQKIIIKYAPSLIWIRLLLAIPTLILIPVLYWETKKTVFLLINRLKNIKLKK